MKIFKNTKNIENIGQERRSGITRDIAYPRGKPQLHWLILLIWPQTPYNSRP